MELDLNPDDMIDIVRDERATTTLPPHASVVATIMDGRPSANESSETSGPHECGRKRVISGDPNDVDVLLRNVQQKTINTTTIKTTTIKTTTIDQETSTENDGAGIDIDFRQLREENETFRRLLHEAATGVPFQGMQLVQSLIQQQMRDDDEMLERHKRALDIATTNAGRDGTVVSIAETRKKLTAYHLVEHLKLGVNQRNALMQTCRQAMVPLTAWLGDAPPLPAQNPMVVVTDNELSQLMKFTFGRP